MEHYHKLNTKHFKHCHSEVTDEWEDAWHLRYEIVIQRENPNSFKSHLAFIHTIRNVIKPCVCSKFSEIKSYEFKKWLFSCHERIYP